MRAVLDVRDGMLLVEPDLAVKGAQCRVFHPTVAAFGAEFLFSWTDYRGRGEFGLAEQNAGLMDAEGTPRYFALQQPAAGRKVLAPTAAPNGLVGFIAPINNRNNNNLLESRLVLRQVQPDGTSPGEDVEIETNAAWPELVTAVNGASLLIYTAVNATERSDMLKARFITRP